MAGARADWLAEACQLADQALDITRTPLSAEFGYAISAVAPVAENLIRHLRDAAHIISIVPVAESANAGNRVKIDELYHRTDAETLQAVVNAASRGILNISIAKTFRLEDISAAQGAVAFGIGQNFVLIH